MSIQILLFDEEYKTFNNSQKKAINFILQTRKNVFITGAAGVGKSYVLRYLIKKLQSQYQTPGKIAVTASTGIAGTLLNGQTLHSFAGIGVSIDSAAEMLEKLSKDSRQRWKQVEVLVIDEISMVDGDFFNKLDFLAKKTRNKESPFGGIQLIICGDFYQLPPVPVRFRRVLYAFNSEAWKNANITKLELTDVVRQSGHENQGFVQMLKEIREGICSQKTIDELNQCHIDVKPIPADGILPTKLYCTNIDVDQENRKCLHRLPGKQVEFISIDKWKRGSCNPAKMQHMESVMERKLINVLKLKVGAQVMLTKNMSYYGLVNGSRGVVIRFDYMKNDQASSNNQWTILPVVRFDNNVELMVSHNEEFISMTVDTLARKQLPLKLGWALTVHKSQGMTLTRVELNLTNAFDFGQVYVALSRVASLSGLFLSSFLSSSVVRSHPDVKAYYGTNDISEVVNKDEEKTTMLTGGHANLLENSV